MLDGFWKDALDNLPAPNVRVLGWSENLKEQVVVYYDKLALDFKSVETGNGGLVITSWTELPSNPMGV